MNAVILIGGKQYCVAEGEKIFVEKIDKKIGEEVLVDKVLMIRDGAKSVIGKPTVDGASVKAEILSQVRAPKIIVFKRRPKKGYKKTIGHRQYMTELAIREIKTK